VDLVAVCDTDTERGNQVAAQYGTRAVASHRDLAGLVDIATVAVPTERHFEVTRDLLEAGVHVLVEKPMTPTIEEAKELFRVARQRGRVLHVGHVERFNGAVQELRKIVEQPILIESRRLGPFVQRVQNDSVVMDLMIHDIDIVLGLVDSEPRRMNCLGRSIHSRQTDVANVQILFDSGAMATITASRATEEKIRTLSITQPDAYIVLNYADQDIQIHRRAAQEYTLNRESIRYRQASFVERLFVHKDNPLKLEIRHLISAARAAQATGQADSLETEDLRSLAVALEIERMIREGRGEVAWPKDLPWSAASQ
jgi:predicted dehydrogenase